MPKSKRAYEHGAGVTSLAPTFFVHFPEQSKGKRKQSVEMAIFARQAMICKAFAHPARLKLLELVGQRVRRLGDLRQELGISYSNLSQHLTVLKAAGILATYRDGSHVYAQPLMPQARKACALIRRSLRGQR